MNGPFFVHATKCKSSDKNTRILGKKRIALTRSACRNIFINNKQKNNNLKRECGFNLCGHLRSLQGHSHLHKMIRHSAANFVQHALEVACNFKKCRDDISTQSKHKKIDMI